MLIVRKKQDNDWLLDQFIQRCKNSGQQPDIRAVLRPGAGLSGNKLRISASTQVEEREAIQLHIQRKMLATWCVCRSTNSIWQTVSGRVPDHIWREAIFGLLPVFAVLGA